MENSCIVTYVAADDITVMPTTGTFLTCSWDAFVFQCFQSIVVSDASAGSFMVTLDLTASGGSSQTSGEIAYNADATGGRTSVQEILQVKYISTLEPF